MKRLILAISTLFMFAPYAIATKLIMINAEGFEITTYPDFSWSTVAVKPGERKIVFDNMDSLLISFTAFEKENTSTTMKKYKLKQNFIDEFNRLQKEKTLLDKSLTIEFPKDFVVEVSLRTQH